MKKASYVNIWTYNIYVSINTTITQYNSLFFLICT